MTQENLLRHDLSGSWRLFYSELDAEFHSLDELENSGIPEIAGSVPGNFELDLLNANLIDDPFIGMNIADLVKWESFHFWYGRSFSITRPRDSQPWLLFEGVDCYADVYLNGRKVGTCDNSLVDHEFLLSEILCEGTNELLVHIRPVRKETESYQYPPLLTALRGNFESLYVRKAPHVFGWDIMPRALSGGIWKPACIVFKRLSRIETTFLRNVSADEERAVLILHYQLRLHVPGANYEIEIAVRHDDSGFESRERVLFHAGRIQFNILKPARWWPRGRGDQNLYEVTIRLLMEGEEVDRHSWKHGIRTIALERTSTTDESGRGAFCFHVNGERLFILGTNWVPASPFHSQDLGRMPQILELAEECGCNMLRCWGGNVYESDEFFDLCDQKGFLIWQDFAMACAVYPQDEEFKKRLESEARKVIRRLRRHACLALWAGDNECDQARGWFNAGDPNSNILTREILPRVVREEDPERSFLPSSPYIDEHAYGQSETYLPENHLWGTRAGFKTDYYKKSLCHFASEIGYHGSPSADSVKKFITAENLWPPQNSEWLLHATSPVPGVDIHDYRVSLMVNQIREFFGINPDSLEDFAFQSQCVQAEALKFFIELFRIGKWRRTGIIWWNLCDGWPQFSDAIVDYYFEKKLAFDYVKCSQTPLCLMVREAQDWKHVLVACNDSREHADISYRVWNLDTRETLCSGQRKAHADSATWIDEFPATTTQNHFLVIEWTATGISGANHYLTGQPAYDPNQYRVWIQKYAKIRDGH